MDALAGGGSKSLSVSESESLEPRSELELPVESHPTRVGTFETETIVLGKC